MHRNVMVIGKMGAGKSTVKDFLVEEMGYEWCAFAKRLKEIAVELYGPEALKSREILQGLGNYCRSLDENVWVRPVLEEIRRHNAGETSSGKHGVVPPRPVVIDDGRFPNEVAQLLVYNPLLIAVEAPVDARRYRLKENGKWGGEEALEDISETALDGCPVDFTIVNDGTFTPGEIHAGVREIIEAHDAA